MAGSGKPLLRRLVSKVGISHRRRVIGRPAAAPTAGFPPTPAVPWR